jgi:hypothetical protein
MNLKKSLFTGLAAVGLMASLAAPVAMAQPAETSTSNNGISGYVTVNSTGSFDVYFGGAYFDLGTITLSAASPEGTATGGFTVWYTDTMPDRPSFDVQLTASTFTHTTMGWNTIPNSGFAITSTANVEQGQFGGPSSTTAGSSPFEIGDIGHYQNGIYPTAGQGTTTAWTTNNTLDSTRTIQFGYSGVGTIWSSGDVGVALDVPANTVTGQYQSNLTLSVITGLQP